MGIFQHLVGNPHACGRRSVGIRKILLLCTSLAVLLCGCGADGPVELPEAELPEKAQGPGLYSFSYRHSCMDRDGSFACEVKEEDGISIIRIADGTNPEQVFPADGEILAEIEKMISDCGLSAWNGFDESDARIQDGDAFSLSYILDGTSVKAVGSGVFPEAYEETAVSIRELFHKIAQKQTGETAQRKK